MPGILNHDGNGVWTANQDSLLAGENSCPRGEIWIVVLNLRGYRFGTPNDGLHCPDSVRKQKERVSGLVHHGAMER